MKTLTLLFLSVLFLVSCACKNKCEDETAREIQRNNRCEILKDVDVIGCLENGGVVRNVCLAQTPACIYSYLDFGKECRDSSECQGRCEIPDKTSVPGTPAVGTCSKDNYPCGCYAIVENGISQGSACRD